ncbi:MAG: hypothetical protein A7316_09405 [Candidatus Altiarchaeales archaeon WOR_SM1_86-2]|nr:MAG: hypothetical protein A7316_09405 [Candidatus Altiarchaeales archaeon WOR_SM1_86-2]ODS41081.1 MAG: hypothetical protein A7315_07115 [Candidatus Altiarchaeales archaeon WOR_SM1_79]
MKLKIFVLFFVVSMGAGMVSGVNETVNDSAGNDSTPPQPDVPPEQPDVPPEQPDVPPEQPDTPAATAFISEQEKQAIILNASGDMVLFDSEPVYIGSYIVEGKRYDVVEYKNPVAGGYSIFDENGIRTRDEMIGKKVIAAMYISTTVRYDFDGFSDNLENNKNIVNGIHITSKDALNALNAVISSGEIRGYASDNEYGSIADAIEALNEVNGSSHSTLTSMDALSSSVMLLMNNNNYDNANSVIMTHKNYTDSLDKLDKDLNAVKSKIDSADKNLRKIGSAAIGKSADLGKLASDAVSTVQSLDYAVDIYTENRRDMSSSGILKMSPENLEAEINGGVDKFNVRLNPDNRLYIIAAAMVVLCLVAVVGFVIIQRRREEMEERLVVTHREGVGSLNVTVVESGTRMPVMNAKATLIGEDGERSELVTDDKGLVIFSDTKSGKYTLRVFSETHTPASTEIHVDPGYNSSRIILSKK